MLKWRANYIHSVLLAHGCFIRVSDGHVSPLVGGQSCTQPGCCDWAIHLSNAFSWRIKSVFTPTLSKFAVWLLLELLLLVDCTRLKINFILSYLILSYLFSHVSFSSSNERLASNSPLPERMVTQFTWHNVISTTEVYIARPHRNNDCSFTGGEF